MKLKKLLFAIPVVLILIAAAVFVLNRETATDDNIAVFVSFEGYNLGHGFYIEPAELRLPLDSNGAEATENLLTERGYAYTDGGEFGFYLAAVDGFDKGFADPPSYITEEINSDGRTIGGTIGGGDYTPDGAWMVTVNHQMLSVGIGDYILQDGDVIRWQFSIQGWGDDLGVDGEWNTPLYEHADKTELICALFTGGAEQSAIRAALGVIIDPLATAADVNAALQNLNA